MRWTAPLALIALLLQGCFVFDEINKGQKELDRYGGAGGQPRAEKSAAPQPAQKPKAPEPGLLARAQAWWAEKNEPKPPQRDPSDKIVRCDVGHSSQYMYASDCRARAGRVL
jgi:hypothetical protein